MWKHVESTVSSKWKHFKSSCVETMLVETNYGLLFLSSLNLTYLLKSWYATYLTHDFEAMRKEREPVCDQNNNGIVCKEYSRRNLGKYSLVNSLQNA